MKALVGAFNQEKARVGAFSVIVQLHRLIDLRHYFQHSMSITHGPGSSEGGVVLHTASTIHEGANNYPIPICWLRLSFSKFKIYLFTFARPILCQWSTMVGKFMSLQQYPLVCCWMAQILNQTRNFVICSDLTELNFRMD